MILKFEERNFDKLPIVHKQPKNEKEEKYLREVIEVEFLNAEQPGLMNKFTYGDTKTSMTFHLFHNGKYRLPRHVVRHLQSRQTPIYKRKPTYEGPINKDLIGFQNRITIQQAF